MPKVKDLSMDDLEYLIEQKLLEIEAYKLRFD